MLITGSTTERPGASTVSVALIATGAERASDAHVLYTSARTLIYTLAIPFSVTALVTGIVLRLGTHWGVLRHRWVAAKLCLLVAVILNGALVIRPLIGQLIEATSATGSAAQGLGATRWTIPALAALNVVFAATSASLAVFKARRPAAPKTDEFRRPRRSHLRNPTNRRMGMRKVIVSEFVSVDGVMEDPGGVEGFDRGGWAFKFDREPEGDKFKLDAPNVRLISHRSFGFHSAAPLIALIYLCCGGITIDLPVR